MFLTVMIVAMHYGSVLAFGAIYYFASVSWGTPHLVAGAYAVASAACFIVYAVDKAAAKAGRWRASETMLLLMGLACGWPGAALAQRWLRHKSSKASFGAKFWVTVVLNVGAFVYLSAPSNVIVLTFQAGNQVLPRSAL